MSATSRATRRLKNDESGWTLIEVLLVAALLIVVLTAVLSVADGTQQTAASDQERTNTIGDAQTGIARIADDLRRSCLVFSPAGPGFAGYVCRTNFTTPPGTSACTRASDCIDVITIARTSVARPTGSATRALQRVRIDCGQADAATSSRTQCTRYAAQCTATSCPSPSSVSGVLVRAVTNGGVTGSPANVFIYCTRESISSAAGAAACAATPATAGAVQISLAVSRRGQRRVDGLGSGGSFYLQEAAELKNINQDAS
jgi:type II secretory pathway pseudopilin PulG